MKFKNLANQELYDRIWEICDENDGNPDAITQGVFDLLLENNIISDYDDSYESDHVEEESED